VFVDIKCEKKWCFDRKNAKEKYGFFENGPKMTFFDIKSAKKWCFCDRKVRKNGVFLMVFL
jgi:hypothetical protein